MESHQVKTKKVEKKLAQPGKRWQLITEISLKTSVCPRERSNTGEWVGDSRNRRSREPTPPLEVPLWAGGKKSLAHNTGQKKIRMWGDTEKLQEGRETPEPWLPLGGRQEGHHLLRVMKAGAAEGRKMKLWSPL